MITPYSLIVVDMQPFFSDSNHRPLIDNVAREEKRAVSRQSAIIFTEIAYVSPMDAEPLKGTHPELTNLVAGYGALRTVEKMISQYSPLDSALMVINCARKHGFPLLNFRVAGVHTGGWHTNYDGTLAVTGCVFEMVYGLSTLLPDAQITVVKNACRDTRPGAKVDWNDFLGLSPRVTVV